MNRVETDFLTSTSSFMGGMATVFNLGGNFFDYNRSRTPTEADAHAMEADWRIVGQDIADAIESGLPKDSTR